MSDFEEVRLSCTVCGRDFGHSDVFYTARSPNDEEVATVRRLFGVDIFSDFDVCRDCVANTAFDEWIEERLATQRTSHNWKREGF